MAEFMPLDGDKSEHRLGWSRAGAEGEFTTEIKGQFGHDQSSGTGN